MKLEGLGLFVDDMPTMVRFYRDVLGFEITEGENAVNVYLVKDGTLFMLYERKNFEKMTSRKYEYLKGINGHFEIALYVIPLKRLIWNMRRRLKKVLVLYWNRQQNLGDNALVILQTLRVI